MPAAPPRTFARQATLVYMLRGMGIETGVDLERLVEASRAAESIVGRALPSKVLKAGVRSLRA